MEHKDFTKVLSVGLNPEKAFDAIRDVRGWWSGLYGEQIEGRADKINDEFTFRAGGGAHYSKQKLVELIPGQKISWLVTDSKLGFLRNQTEWTGTRINFEITKADNKTRIVFSHTGLVPGIECYHACSNGWTGYLQKFEQKLS